jgi:hypothetical protein
LAAAASAAAGEGAGAAGLLGVLRFPPKIDMAPLFSIFFLLLLLWLWLACVLLSRG